VLNFGNPEPKNMGELVPAGTLAWAVFALQEKRYGRESGAGYYAIELTIEGGPFNRRKVFTMISDPLDANASEEGRTRAFGTMKRALESSGLLNPQTAPQFANVHPDTVIQWLAGKKVAVKVGIEKGKDGYADKNKVADWLSPNPESGGYKLFAQLINPPPAAPAQGSFGAAAPGGFTAPAAAPGGFGAPASASPAPNAGGFTAGPATQQPGGFGTPAAGFQPAAAPGFQQPQAGPPALSAASPTPQGPSTTTASPSSGAAAVGMGAPGGWLAAGQSQGGVAGAQQR
jgi:hypothetical protein